MAGCISAWAMDFKIGGQMKRIILIGLGVVLGLFFISCTIDAAEKIGYVSLERLFDDYHKTKEYDKILEGKQKSYEADRQKKVEEVKKLQDKFSVLSKQEKEAKKGLLEEKIKALQDFDKEKTANLRKERDEKMREILKDIEKAISAFAKKEGYSLIFNDRVLVYQEKALDVTDKVFKILQKQGK
jgi:outer membrane protein